MQNICTEVKKKKQRFVCTKCGLHYLEKSLIINLMSYHVHTHGPNQDNVHNLILKFLIFFFFSSFPWYSSSLRPFLCFVFNVKKARFCLAAGSIQSRGAVRASSGQRENFNLGWGFSPRGRKIPNHGSKRVNLSQAFALRVKELLLYKNDDYEMLKSDCVCACFLSHPIYLPVHALKL